METKDMIKTVLIVGIVVLFLTETFYFGGGFFKPTTPTTAVGDNITGTAIVTGTIRTYDPILVIPVDTNQSIIDQLRLKSGVRDVKNDPKGIIIETETRDDVFPIAAWLRTINVSGYSVANIAIDHNLEVNTPTGIVNATLSGGVVRVLAEPLIDVDTEVTVSLIAVVRNNQVIDYGSAYLMMDSVNITLNSTITALNYKVYTYSIPWENRTSIGNLTQYGDVDYKRIDSIVFDSPLTVEQILIKKQYPYVTYIDSTSALVEPTFNNLSMLQTNFGDTPFTLRPSTLVIRTNQTPDLAFTPTVRYSYSFKLQNSSYQFDSEYMTLDSSVEYPLDTTVPLNISALVLGNKVVSVKRVLLPS